LIIKVALPILHTQRHILPGISDGTSGLATVAIAFMVKGMAAMAAMAAATAAIAAIVTAIAAAMAATMVAVVGTKTTVATAVGGGAYNNQPIVEEEKMTAAATAKAMETAMATEMATATATIMTPMPTTAHQQQCQG
jgi:hypothetical protein